ncbi:MAG: hypothetical protein DME57_00350 [Verrucomicrobia bacterium]|nr:MAG: hypothetical protein DME57_00350 [Verrucomicrobiota bacterium]
MLSALDCAKSGDAIASATSEAANVEKRKYAERLFRQWMSFIGSGEWELELSEPPVCSSLRKKVKNILLFLQKKHRTSAAFLTKL